MKFCPRGYFFTSNSIKEISRSKTREKPATHLREYDIFQIYLNHLPLPNHHLNSWGYQAALDPPPRALLHPSAIRCCFPRSPSRRPKTRFLQSQTYD